MTSGIYTITCQKNGKKYVGRSAYIENRWSAHRQQLIKGKHMSQSFQTDWYLYGEEAFSWDIVEECPSTEELFYREAAWIAHLRPEYNGEIARSREIKNTGKGMFRKGELIRHNKVTDDLVHRAIALRQRGFSMKKIAEALDVSLGALKRKMPEDLVKRKDPLEGKLEYARQQKAKGKDHNLLARELGVSPETLRIRLKGG